MRSARNSALDSSRRRLLESKVSGEVGSHDNSIRAGSRRLGRHRRADERGAAGTSAESGESRHSDRRRRQVQHVAGLCHRAHEPAREGRQLRGHHLRQPRPPGRVEGTGFPADSARQQQGRDLRVREDHQREGAQLSGPVVRRPDALRGVRDGPDARAGCGRAPAAAGRRPRWPEHQQSRRHLPDGRHQRR